MIGDNQLHKLTDLFAGMIGHRPTACVVTFGCQMNARDSEKLRGVLDGAGFELSDSEKADFVIYNTCTVRENANTRVYGRLGQLKNYKKRNPHMILAVCGCMMQEPGATQTIKKKLPFIDMVFGTFNLYEFPALLAEVLDKKIAGREEPVIDVWDKESTGEADSLPSKRTYAFKAGVNIMYGCNNFCSYCIVPYVRGRERSRNKQDILDEIDRLKQDGVREIMLLGQNVNSYGKTLDEKVSFAELLESIAVECHLERIRFMTSHPKDLSDELIDVMARYDSICNHLHLPVQSGSNRILQRMNRHYTREAYFELVEKLRKAIPDISLTTDIMVGFPGERREDIEDTIDLIKQVGFDNAFTFIYSKRTGTPAALMSDQIDPQTASAWFDLVLEAVHETAGERCARFAGTDQVVLVEDRNKHRDGWLTGRTQHNLLVHFEGPADLIGTSVEVEITESKGFYLIGRRVQE